MTDNEVINIYKQENLKIPSLCKKYPEIKEYLQNRFPVYKTLVEVMFRILNNISEIPKCPVCNKELPFVSMQIGYRTFCCNECCNSELGKKIQKDKLKAVILKKYGVENIMQKKEFHQKAENTLLKKYGQKYPAQIQKFKDKMKQTFLDHYGVEYAIQSVELKNKIKNTMLQRYGVEHGLQIIDAKNKFKQTMLQRYGVEYTAQSDELKEKMKQTNYERYGVDNPMKNKAIQSKVQKTVKEKYGVNYISQSEEIKQKMKENNFKKYGVEYIQQVDEVKEKVKQTFIKKYGNDYIKYFIEKGKQTKLRNKTYTTSKIELKLFEELKNLFGEEKIKYQYNSNEYPFMCDFYLIDYNLYIEIQGNWTHGKHPFDENNLNDINLLNKWKSKTSNYYKSAIDVWSFRDPIKRNTAKTNNLNYIEIFSIDLKYCLNSINDYILNKMSGYKLYIK